MDSPHLLSLAGRCEAASGPDRELDREIKFAMFCLPIPEGYLWAGYAVDDRFKYMEIDGTPLRPDHAAPPFTASLDAATGLVPTGWYWRAGHGVLWPGWAHLNLKHPSDCDREDEHSAHAETPALALCAAALKARASQSHSQTERGEGK